MEKKYFPKSATNGCYEIVKKYVKPEQRDEACNDIMQTIEKSIQEFCITYVL